MKIQPEGYVPDSPMQFIGGARDIAKVQSILDAI